MPHDTTPSTTGVSRTTFLVLTWLLTALSGIFLIVRLCIRVRRFKVLKWDDALVILAWYLLLGTAVLWQVEINTLYWFNAVVKGASPPSHAFINAASSFIPNIVTWNILYLACLWSVKYSFLVLFRRIDGKIYSNRVLWWIVFAVTTIGLAVAIGIIDYGCSLGNLEHIFKVCNDPAHVQYNDNILYATTGIDVFTDILILAIPIKITWQVEISKKQKLVLWSIFAATIVVMIISIIRAALVVPNPSSNSNNSLGWQFLWSIIEMAVAIMIANVASFRQLFGSPGGSSNGQSQQSQSSTATATTLSSIASYLPHPKCFWGNESSSSDSSLEKGQEQQELVIRHLVPGPIGWS